MSEKSEKEKLLDELAELTNKDKVEAERQELEELRLLVKARKELGRQGVDFAVVGCPLGKVVVKKPQPLVWRAASEKFGATDDEAILVKVAVDICEKHIFGTTTGKTVAELTDECPGVIKACFQAAAYLMGETSKQIEKK